MQQTFVCFIFVDLHWLEIVVFVCLSHVQLYLSRHTPPRIAWAWTCGLRKREKISHPIDETGSRLHHLYLDALAEQQPRASNASREPGRRLMQPSNQPLMLAEHIEKPKDAELDRGLYIRRSWHTIKRSASYPVLVSLFMVVDTKVVVHHLYAGVVLACKPHGILSCGYHGDVVCCCYGINQQ